MRSILNVKTMKNFIPSMIILVTSLYFHELALGSAWLPFHRFSQEQQVCAEKCLKELDKLAEQRRVVQKKFNAFLDWSNISRNRYLSAWQPMPRILVENSPEIYIVYQIRIEGDELIIQYADPSEETIRKERRHSISGLKCKWDLKQKRAASNFKFTIWFKKPEHYLMFARTINELRDINNSVKSTIAEIVNYINGNEKLINQGKIPDQYFKIKKSELLEKIEDYYKDYYFESEYSYTMKDIIDMSMTYRHDFNIFDFQVDHDEASDNESWLNESRQLFASIFRSLLKYPSLIFQLDIHCLSSLIRQSTLMFYSEENFSKLLDEFLLDKDGYLLAQLDHLSRISDSFIKTTNMNLTKEDFLPWIKIESDILFIANQIQEKRKFYDLESLNDLPSKSASEQLAPKITFVKPYIEELESKYYRSLLRSFILLHSFLDYSQSRLKFIEFITSEQNSDENTKLDQDFNIYGRWGSVGYFLEKIIMDIDKGLNAPLSRANWEVISYKIKNGTSIDQLEKYFSSLLREI